MEFDLQADKKSLTWLRGATCAAWGFTIVLFAYPAYQWLTLGKIPIDSSFAALTALNVAMIFISAKLSSRTRFLRYRIKYFLSQGE